MFQTKVVEKIKAHILFPVTFLRKSCRLCENVEKYCRAGRATNDSIAHAHCMLDTQGYEYTHSGCVIRIVFPQQQWLHERASCYIIHTMPILFFHSLV